jgi:hypothetical protein
MLEKENRLELPFSPSSGRDALWCVVWLKKYDNPDNLGKKVECFHNRIINKQD